MEACGLGLCPDGKLGDCYMITHVVFNHAVISVTRVLKLNVIQHLMSCVWAAQETEGFMGSKDYILLLGSS